MFFQKAWSRAHDPVDRILILGTQFDYANACVNNVTRFWRHTGLIPWHVKDIFFDCLDLWTCNLHWVFAQSYEWSTSCILRVRLLATKGF
jgi:hypothetical protein